MFSCKEFWIITLIILLIVYILGKSKHLIRQVDIPCEYWPPCWRIQTRTWSSICRKPLTSCTPLDAGACDKTLMQENIRLNIICRRWQPAKVIVMILWLRNSQWFMNSRRKNGQKMCYEIVSYITVRSCFIKRLINT